MLTEQEIRHARDVLRKLADTYRAMGVPNPLNVCIVEAATLDFVLGEERESFPGGVNIADLIAGAEKVFSKSEGKK